MAIFRRDPPNGDSECRGYEKVAIFDQFLAISWKRYKIAYSHSYYGMRIGTLSKLSNGTIFYDLEWPLTQTSRSQYYLMSNNSKTIQDRAIVTVAAINDLERPVTKISRSHQYLTLIISETVRDRHSYNEILIGLNALLMMSLRMIWSDPEWLSERFSDKKHPAVSLRQLNFLFIVSGRHFNDRREFSTTLNFYTQAADDTSRRDILLRQRIAQQIFNRWQQQLMVTTMRCMLLSQASSSFATCRRGGSVNKRGWVNAARSTSLDAVSGVATA